jgi:hypothetical protein
MRHVRRFLTPPSRITATPPHKNGEGSYVRSRLQRTFPTVTCTPAVTPSTRQKYWLAATSSVMP